jgi:PAS domain S-box-containing protein
MGRELLAVLDQFGAGGGGDPGNDAVRFLLAAFFWTVLAGMAWQNHRRSRETRDLLICAAALIGLSRELIMFFLEYGTHRGFIPPIVSFRVFPPLEHALTDIGRAFLGMAYLRYFLLSRRIGNLVGVAGAAAFGLLYLVTAPLWVRHLDANHALYGEPIARFGLFWGDMAFRVTASTMLAAVLLALAFGRGGGRRIPLFLYGAFAFLFLDEFLMIFNLATGDEPYRKVLAPIRHNLAIWAVPLLIGAYWLEAMRRIEDERSRSEGILLAIRDGISIEAPDHTVLFQNPAHVALRGNLVGRPCNPPDGECSLVDSFREGRGTIREVTVPAADGTIDVEVSTSLLKDGEGKTVGGIKVIRDISERRHAEEALRASEALYRTLVENIDLGITLVDREYRIVMANAAMGRQLERPTGEFIGRHCFREFEGRDSVCDHCPGARAMAEGHPASVELQRTAPGGRALTIEIQAFPVTAADGSANGFIEIVEDVTQAREAALERTRLEAKLQQTQKMESLGILAGGIAHDFNNLLMGILGHVDLALAKVPPESPVRPYLRLIDTSAQRAADLTNQMLAYSGRGRFVVEPIDLSRLVEEMGFLMGTIISKNVVLKYNLARDLPAVAADATQIRQVVMNLITNASDAIGNLSGIITVTTGQLEADREYLASTYLDEELPGGTYVFLEVTDTGAGMDRETQARIFDPFFSTKKSGRGLGLAAALGIIRGHRGALRLYSEIDRGTTFKILLPAAGNAAEVPLQPSPQPAGAAPEPGQASGTVLVVDDDEAVRSVARMMLETAGYTVITAVDGVEGVEAFGAHAGEIDLVILDMTMPRMDGEEAYRRMRNIRADVRVILSSGYSEMDAVNRFTGKHLAGFIQKPYRARNLVEKVSEALSGNGRPG